MSKPHPVTTAARAKASAGLAAAPTRPYDQLIPERVALELLGGVSFMFLRRRLAADPAFPIPLVKLGRRRFYWRNDVLRWIGSTEAARPLPNPHTKAGGAPAAA